MVKLISAILIGLFLCGEYLAQPKLFGYKISGNGDIISNEFHIQNGFVLDSVKVNNRTFYFKYNENGKLIIDINFLRIPVQVLINGRLRIILQPGYRHYLYNHQGDIDSVGTGLWKGTLPSTDSSGYRISYMYDKDGNLLSKKYSIGGYTDRLEENSYDLSGNLILNKIILFNYPDTTYNIRQYDSLNRLTLSKTVHNSNPGYDQYLYEYDSSGNVNCTIQTFSNGTISNNYRYYLEFDESGKLIYQNMSRAFNPSDSTWLENTDILMDYDEYGRILKMGSVVRFHYDDNGNLDTLVNTHVVSSGYLGGKGKIIDPYGNTIVLPEFYGLIYFYYSKLVTDIKENNIKDMSFNLYQNYPNPFNPVTSITYSLPTSSFVTLKIYDILGKEIATLVNEEKSGGIHNVTWNGKDITSGVYFYKITAGEYSKVNKMILLK